MKFEYTKEEYYELNFNNFNSICLYEYKGINCFKYSNIGNIKLNDHFLLNDGYQQILKNYTNLNVGLILNRKFR